MQLSRETFLLNKGTVSGPQYAIRISGWELRHGPRMTSVSPTLQRVNTSSTEAAFNRFFYYKFTLPIFLTFLKQTQKLAWLWHHLPHPQMFLSKIPLWCLRICNLLSHIATLCMISLHPTRTSAARNSLFCLLIGGIVGKVEIGKKMGMGNKAPREYNMGSS